MPILARTHLELLAQGAHSLALLKIGADAFLKLKILALPLEAAPHYRLLSDPAEPEVLYWRDKDQHEIDFVLPAVFPSHLQHWMIWRFESRPARFDT